MSQQIKVSNPPNGGFSYIGHAHAERLVKQGRAEFDRLGCLRLAQRARVSAASIESGRGYDQVGRSMTSAERRAIPLVGGRA